MTAVEERHPGSTLDRIAALLAAMVIVGLAVFLLVRNEAIVDPRLFFVLRVVLSFSMAVLGATIPGFLHLKWTGGGLAIRAGGAVALFALTFMYTPDLVVDPAPAAPPAATSVSQSSTGDLSPPIANNSGTVIITGAADGQ